MNSTWNSSIECNQSMNGNAVYTNKWRIACKNAILIMAKVRWSRELNALQPKKTHANRKITRKLRKYLHEFDNICAANTLNPTKKKNAIQKQKHAANIYNTTKHRNVLQIAHCRHPHCYNLKILTSIQKKVRSFWMVAFDPLLAVPI